MGTWKYNPFSDELDYSEVGLSSTNYTGTNCTGNDGATNRTLTANAKLIVVDNQFLHPTVDYSVSGTTITFLNPIFNSQNITAWI